MPMHARILLLATIVAVSVGPPAWAQESRAEAIEQEQARKAAALKPYEPDALERVMTRVQRVFIETPSGFYPYFGSVYSGGGFAMGPGYRQFYGDRTFWDAKGLLSIRGYKLIELSTVSPGHAQGRADLFASAGWKDATAVAFYGTGIDTKPAARTNFGLTQTFATLGLVSRPIRWTTFNAAVAVEDFNTSDGSGSSPSTLAVHTPISAPGLLAKPTYLHTMVSGGVDWRPAAGYARRGGLYELTYHNYTDRNDSYSFDRLDAQLVQHFPVLRENWVFSFRGQVQTTLDDHDVVPFFMMPSLGSGSTLRAYTSWRFRDRHSMLGSMEWRWIPNRLGIDMAIFADTGKVARRRSDLSLDGLKTDIGIGVRFHGPALTMFRIDLARGTEGFHLVLTSGAAF